MSSPGGPVRRARLAARDIHDYLRTIESTATGGLIPADATILTHRMTALTTAVASVTELAKREGATS